MTEFEGQRDSLECYLRGIKGSYYVYELCKPDGTVFYVGKGSNRRVFEHELEALRRHPMGESNPFKCNVIRKIDREEKKITYRIDRVFDDNQEAACLAREAELISRYGRLHEGGPLTNLAGGFGSVSGSTPHSIEKHAATLSGAPKNNPERAKLNIFLQGIGPVESVPIKPINQISRILPTLPHPNKRSPTPRCAFALMASAAAHGLQFVAGVRIPRAFEYDGVEGIVENGVARDMVKAAMVTLHPADDPKHELFELDKRQCELLTALVGREHLIVRGLS